MRKLRASYSLLNAWKRGDIQGAIDMYLHKQLPMTMEASDGKDYHDALEKRILKDKVIKIGGTVILFNDPKPELKLFLPYNDLFDLSGRFDCVDGDTLYEFKTGKTDILDYVNGYQIPFYFLMSKIHGLQIEKCHLIHYNQYEDRAEFVEIWNSDEAIEKARNYIDSIGPEIYKHFQEIGIL